jgi:hypothetical protein
VAPKKKVGTAKGVAIAKCSVAFEFRKSGLKFPADYCRIDNDLPIAAVEMSQVT